MSFSDAVTTVLTKKYADFSGRARRSEYWWFALAELVVLGLLFALGRASSILMILYYLAALAVIIPALAVGIRRLHDTGRSGWWILLGVIPIVNLVGWIVLLVFFVSDSTPGDNQYGPSPKAIAAPYGA
jgi:uncharacterized membrane protein YhaH (DUF805 family)